MKKRVLSSNIESILPLTPMQESLLFELLCDPKGKSNFEQQKYCLWNCLNFNLVRLAWNIMAEYIPVLRTVFRWEQHIKPVQIILKEKEIPVIQYDLSDEKEVESLLKEIEEKAWKRNTDLRTDPLEVIWCKTLPNKAYMIIRSHHLILDGWSNALLLKEFIMTYDRLQKGYSPMRQKEVSYKNYILWINEEHQKKQPFLWWNDYLEGFPFEKKPIKYENPVTEYSGQIYTYVFSEEKRNKLYQFTADNQITLASLFYSVWGIILHMEYGKLDNLFGVTVSGRDIAFAGIEELVASCIKTLPLRVKLTEDTLINDYLHKVNKDLNDIKSMQHVRLSDILPFAGKLSNIFVVQNYPVETDRIQSLGYEIELTSSYYVIPVDLLLGLKVFPQYMELEFCYNGQVYQEKNIMKYSENFIKIFSVILEYFNQELTVKELEHDLAEQKGGNA